jgi:hypothetical protein
MKKIKVSQHVRGRVLRISYNNKLSCGVGVKCRDITTFDRFFGSNTIDIIELYNT